MSLNIRPIEQNDFTDWLPLWDGNNDGVRNEEVTTECWSRLTDPEFPIHGFVVQKDGKLAGLVHYVIHNTTGNIQPVCYMQDLYVDPAFRKQGLARKLVERVVREAKKENWARMYWLAEANNEAAQNLYKTIGVKIDFTIHVLLP